MVLAELYEPIEVETPWGGQAVSHEPRGPVWLKPGAARRQGRSEAGVTRTVEVMTATTRTDPRLIEGRLLRFGGGDRVIATSEVDPDRPGQMRLTLERDR